MTGRRHHGFVVAVCEKNVAMQNLLTNLSVTSLDEVREMKKVREMEMDKIDDNRHSF